MKRLTVLFALIPLGMPALAEAPSLSVETVKEVTRTLSSDAFEGRAPATPGEDKTIGYIAGRFAAAGLSPANGTSWFQDVPMVEITADPAAQLLVTGGRTPLSFAYKTDMVAMSYRMVPRTEIRASEIVFVGYGINAPERGWNDYAGLDVKGKTVVILINDPDHAAKDLNGPFGGRAMTYYGRWTYKYEEAARQGAAAALIVHDTAPAAYGWNVVEGSWSGPQIDLQRADDGASRAALEGWITRETAASLFSAAGLDLEAQMLAANRRGFKAVPMTGLKASATITQAIKRSSDANVLGVLKGAEAPDEYVVYMGHWDHLGMDPSQQGDDKIFNGAVDNATGVAGILEIARKFASGPRPRRSVIFAAVTAEESGLLGSAYLAENPPVPLKDIAAGINIDGVLPAPPAKDIIVVGYGASELEDILKKHAEAAGKYLRADPEPEKGYFYRSDHISFAKKGVPMLYADAGSDLVEGGEAAGKAIGDDYTANRYHQPSDEFDEGWDLAGMVQSMEILHAVGAEVANSSGWPTWRDGNEFRAIRDASRAGE